MKGKDVYVNLFMSNTSNLKVEGKAVSLEQATHYPWNGDVTIGVNKNNAGQFTMKIRIPGWVRNQVVPVTCTLIRMESVELYSESKWRTGTEWTEGRLFLHRPPLEERG